jgi:hypothetical protein
MKMEITRALATVLREKVLAELNNAERFGDSQNEPLKEAAGKRFLACDALDRALTDYLVATKAV